MVTLTPKEMRMQAATIWETNFVTAGSSCASSAISTTKMKLAAMRRPKICPAGLVNSSADMMKAMKMAHPPVLGVGTVWTRRCSGISMKPHFFPSHLARGVRTRERKRGIMIGKMNSLTIHILHGLPDAEVDMLHLSGLKEEG